MLVSDVQRHVCLSGCFALHIRVVVFLFRFLVCIFLQCPFFGRSSLVYRIQFYTYNSTWHNYKWPLLDCAQLYTSTSRHSTTWHATTLHRPHGRKVEAAIEQRTIRIQWYLSYPYFFVELLLRLSFVHTVRYYIVASTLRPCGLCRVVACRVLTCRVVCVELWLCRVVSCKNDGLPVFVPLICT